MYAQLDRAWSTKFLSSYTASVLGSRVTGSYANQFAAKKMRMENRSGSAAVIGWGGRLPNDSTLWKAGQWVDASTTFVDDTTDAQDTGTGDFALTTTTNDDGFIVLCQIPFNILSILLSQVTTGAPVYEVSYSIAGGTWTALTLANLLVAPDFATTTGEKVIWWEKPGDWAVTEAGHGTDIPTGYYGLLVKATTAPSQAALATQMVPGVIVDSAKNVASNGYIEWDYSPGEKEIPPQCDALACAFSVAADQNYVSGQWRLKG
jgi:hypothetical protein